MFLVNGSPSDFISLTDRSFQYGDGCFTTMLTRNGTIQYWSYHRDRMNACLDLLQIPHPDWQQVEQWLDRVVRSDHRAGIKLHISRGEGGRGYSPTQVDSPNVTISDFIYPPHYEQWLEQGLSLGICTTRLGHNPLLAGHKHNNRLEQVLLKAEMDGAHLPDGIALDIDDHVIETTMANVFWFRGNQLCTPDLSKSGVSGVIRRVILEWAKANGIAIEVGNFALTDLLDADEVFITNSILGVAPVNQIGEKTFAIGTITKRIQEMVNS